MRNLLYVILLALAGCGSTGGMSPEANASNSEPVTVIHMADLRGFWGGSYAPILVKSRFAQAPLAKTIDALTMLLILNDPKIHPGWKSECQSYRLVEILNPGSDAEIWRVKVCDKVLRFSLSGPAMDPEVDQDNVQVEPN